MEKVPDWLYRGVTIPWMLPYGVAIDIGGQGFTNLLDEINHLMKLNRRSIKGDEWEFVWLWTPRSLG